MEREEQRKECMEVEGIEVYMRERGEQNCREIERERMVMGMGKRKRGRGMERQRKRVSSLSVSLSSLHYFPLPLSSSSTLCSTFSHSTPSSLFPISLIDIYIFFINKINQF